MASKTEKFYNTFSFLYPVIDWLLSRHKKLMVSQVNLMTCATLLEIGVGRGTHLKLYTKKKITAIDISEAMLLAAKANNNNDIDFKVMNAEHLDFGNAAFDCVVVSHVVAVVSDPKKMMSEISRVLKPGGHVLILNHFTPDNVLGKIDKLFSPIAKLLHFRSVFYISDVTHQGLKIVQLTSCGSQGYFKLLIMQKQ